MIAELLLEPVKLTTSHNVRYDRDHLKNLGPLTVKILHRWIMLSFFGKTGIPM
jgi:hypothetical protein